MNKKGSVLITSLWAVSLLAVFTASLSFQGSQHAVLMKREIQNLENKADFLSALHLVEARVYSDSEPYEDSGYDAWHGEIVVGEPWNERISIAVTDEESKLNLNYAEQAFMKEFFELFTQEVGEIKGGPKDFIKQIMKHRAKERIESMEELFLVEDIEREDIERLKPYVTLSPTFGQLNINTAEPLVLKALIQSIPGDAFAKKKLLKEVLEFKDQESVFRSTDLTPNAFFELLDLPKTPQLSQVINPFLVKVTTDSRTYRAKLRSRHGMKTEAILREKGDSHELEVLSWHEL